MSEERNIRERLVKHLDGGEAFMPVTQMLELISFEDINTRPSNLPYSFYELFFHVVFTQKDIVKFSCSDDYTKPKWPEYYWPREKVCKSKEDWKSLKAEYTADRERLKDFLLDGSNNLTEAVKNGKDEQTLLREALLVIEHTAYHTGQMMVVLRLLNLH
ncbi:DinB family protein [Aequorivita viscosa]|uniref:DinB superfamily protein n=1 Tax=Aequorivita viscosa TaxID=797419 RepID=A0A1M6IWR4_9FLAO|nr:DinB family protein [Aequorivita viscosa]SDX14924.1 DinB superfamily protein [Aequorivita viscosa]SHJ38819.1 DinB superfamily protein [Aequorivita viscosa]